MNPLWLSLEIASMSLVLIMILGITLNYILKVHLKHGRALIDSVLTLPLVLPPVVVGFGILMLFSPGYPLGQWLGSHGLAVVFTKMGAVIAGTCVAFPLFYQSMRAALATTDPVIEDVARTLGASEFRIFMTISLPLAWRGILSGAVLSFCRAIGEFGATILVAGNIPGLTRTLPLAIYSSVETGDYSQALLYVIYISALTLTLLWTIHLISGTGFLGGKGEKE